MSSVNSLGTNAPLTRMSLLAEPLSPAACQVSRISQSLRGSSVQIMCGGPGCSSRVPRMIHWHRSLPLENTQSPSTQ